MSERKFSKQREMIRSFLDNNTTHPTADDVYFYVRQELPNISLGTVYRNLNQLADEGEVRRIRLGSSQERFDYNVHTHAHYVCLECGKIFDVPHEKIDVSVPGTIESHDLTVYGHCEECSTKVSK
ncbi:MAG: transcriptional repressor [Eubacteriales bacterium]|nr:transcriptional repressor [Eubacteriales bacterium]